MNCPNCKQPAIDFIKWARGTEAFKTKCSNCGVSLKANVITIIGFVITVLITGAFVFFVKIYIEPEFSKGFLKFLLALPIAITLGFVVFKLGGYKESK
ncbi:MAG: hypothetical protein OEW99_09585 [Gammaproteobacteria bacterium]|nr:hypothetical protein [Gammaproteobacteria bacterium]MDH5660785.1 hypothetical protein [Gammaproteobacteria bacterium]